jgi:WD40 repeat protein
VAQEGKGRPLWHVQFSPDGTQLAAACDSGETILWGRSGQQIRSFSEGSPVRAVAYSPGADLLAVEVSLEFRQRLPSQQVTLALSQTRAVARLDRSSPRCKQ